MKISVWIYFLLRCDAMRLMDFHSHLWFLMIGIDIGSSALRVISSFQVWVMNVDFGSFLHTYLQTSKTSSS